MSFKGYKFLAKKALDQQVDFKVSISCHLFLILCWNLIARCISIGSLMYNHISWNLDSMVIVFPSHKGDKEGKSALPKRVYAYTEEPHICPVLSLAIYIFTRGYDREGSRTSIFSGEAESRFSKLHKLCADNKELLINKGIDISNDGNSFISKRNSILLEWDTRWSNLYCYLPQSRLESRTGPVAIHFRGRGERSSLWSSSNRLAPHRRLIRKFTSAFCRWGQRVKFN